MAAATTAGSINRDCGFVTQYPPMWVVVVVVCEVGGGGTVVTVV